MTVIADKDLSVERRLMRVFTKIPYVTDMLRWYSGRFREGSVVSILSGHARGALWKRHHRYVSGYWTGQYEWPIQQTLGRELRPGGVFWDVGAHAGFFSLVARRLVGGSGAVVSFDPDPANWASIRAQIDVNGFENWTMVRSAVAERMGRTKLHFSYPGDPAARLDEVTGGEHSIDVDVITLDSALSFVPPPTFIKMDIERAETVALQGAQHILEIVRPTWLIELHGNEGTAIQDTMMSCRYMLFSADGTCVPKGGRLPHHVIARPK